MNKRVIITLTILAIIYGVLFDFLRWEQYDTPSFIGGARFLFGLKGGFDTQSRLTKPLILLLPGFIELLTSLHPKYIFIVQNIIFFYLCGIFIYKINQLIFKDDKIAYLGMLAYATCQPFAIYSLFVLSDAAGWFFGILGIYLTLKRFSNPIIKLKSLVVIGVIVGLGCLMKESAIIGMIFLFSYILVVKFSFKKKIVFFTASSIGFIIPLMISFLIIEYFYHDSILKRILQAHLVTQSDHFELARIKQIFRIIDMYWFLFFIGLISVFKILKQQPNNYQLKSILVAIVLVSILLPVWPYLIDRILFLLAPFLIVIVNYGIFKFKQFAFPLVLIGGFLNIFISFIIYKFQTHGIIICGTILFLVVMAIFAMILKKSIYKKFNFKRF